MISKAIYKQVRPFFLHLSLCCLLVCGTPLRSNAQDRVKDSLMLALQQPNSNAHQIEILFSLLRHDRFGDSETLLSYCRDIRQLAKGLENNLDVAEAWQMEGWILDRKGDFVGAIQAFEQAYEIFHQTKESEKEVKTLLQLASSYRQEGDVQNSEEYLQRAKSRANELGNRSLEALVENNQAIVYAQSGQMKRAKIAFERALAIQLELQDSLEVSNLYNNIGNICLKQDQDLEAISNYLKCARIDQALGNTRGLAGGYNQISHVYEKVGDLRSAMEYAKNSFASFKNLGNPNGMAMTLGRQASLLRKQDRWDEAYKNSLQVLDTCIKYGISNENRGHALKDIGLHLHKLEKPEEAISYFTEAEKVYKNSSWESALAPLYLAKGQAQLQLGARSEAIASFELGKKLATEQGDRLRELEAWELLAGMYESTGKNSKALRAFKIAQSMKDSIYTLENTRAIASIQADYDLERHRREKIEQQQLADNLRIDKQMAEARTRFILLVAFALLLLTLGIIAWIRFRARQAKLILEKDQKLAQELLRKERAERHRLESLALQQAEDIGRKSQQFLKVKEELEIIRNENKELSPKDFVHLFKLVENNIRSDEDWNAFKKNFEQIYPQFLPKLLHLHPDNSPSEIRLCVLIRLGMGQKDIANILNIHPDSVKRARNRLRHKLKLNENQDLKEYLGKL